jgi:hypothetical protein
MLRVIAVVVYGIERWGIEDRERAMSILTVQAFLVAIDPYRCVSLTQGAASRSLKSRGYRAAAYMVFQLKFPSYAMLRRCGKLAKSNLLSSVSSPGKKFSNDTTSTDKAANNSPVGVK